MLCTATGMSYASSGAPQAAFRARKWRSTSRGFRHLSVEGGCRHDGVSAEAHGPGGMIDHPRRCHVDHAGEHGDLAGDGLDRNLDHLVALSVGKEGSLSRRTEEEQPCHAFFDQESDQALERTDVDLEVGGKRVCIWEGRCR